ncbi:hypothetical protein [Clavibacter michiganensis]|uniref:hypothetical protein n=1 Tax=Clavibacter michiganensis TaxID=28447 RepID=UPI001BE0F930|nr:hypothetical protein [Clavibacter michiganensis]MBT1634365.1 hypothetical protein [Clavibacter michiganensis]
MSFENEDEEELASVSTEYVLKFVVPDGQQPDAWIEEVGEQDLLTFGEEALYSYHRQAISELTSRMGLPPYRLPFNTESPADQSLDAENASNES